MFSFRNKTPHPIRDAFVARVRRELDEIEALAKPKYDALDAIFAALKREKNNS
jgi:hypothetical protein